tara:strand:+ start:796 stop:1002 length:207 start_codon:yes stop_codon:yes gene_type:complete
MKLQINGIIKTFESESITLDKLIDQLGYNSKIIVVEYNGFIISSNEWNKKAVYDGDKIEIVTIVGGGS